MAEQYDKMMTRKAYLENYKKFSMFSESFDEFDDSRETVRQLID